MATRKSSRRSKSLVRRAYAPVKQALGLAGNTVSAVTNTAKGLARTTVHGVNRLGEALVSRTNRTVKNVLSRKNRKASRKNRKATRKVNRK